MKRGAAPEHDAVHTQAAIRVEDVAVLDTDAGACRSAPDSRPTQGLSTQSHPRRVRERREQSWGHATRRVFVRCARCEDGRRAEDPPATGAGAAARGLGFSRPTICAMRIDRRCPPYAEPRRDRRPLKPACETPHRACFAYNGLCNCRSMAVGRVGAEGPRPSNAVVCAALCAQGSQREP
ncbi:hypothetical protein B0H14DRAFT_2875921, partial [Mycena olivaceomarginata]